MKIKSKKIFVGLGATALSIATISGTAVSCSDGNAKQKNIIVNATTLDIWIASNQGYRQLIANNDLDTGGSIDMPIYKQQFEPTIGNIFRTDISDKVFKINFHNSTKKLLTVEQLNQEFLRVNKEIIFYRDLKNQGNKQQFIAFVNYQVGEDITVTIKALKPVAPDEKNFLTHVSDNYDFLTAKFDDVHANGQILQAPGLLKKQDSYKKILNNTNGKTIESWDYIYNYNRFGVNANAWEKVYAISTKRNLLAETYIDYKNHVSKIMTISIDGGDLVSSKSGLVESIRFQNAKSVEYKITTMNNYIPLSKSKTTASHADKILLKKLLKVDTNVSDSGLITKWMGKTLQGATGLNSALKMISGSLPQIQPLIHGIETFTDEWVRQKANFDKTTGILHKWHDNSKLKLFSDVTQDVTIDKMIDALENHNFNFESLQQLQDVLKGVEKGHKFPLLGNSRSSELEKRNWENLNRIWVIQSWADDQFIITNLCLLLKNISQAWSEVK